MLCVYSEKQKKLLELIANWDEDAEYFVEAPIRALFLCGGGVFDPSDFPVYLDLNYQQLLQLKEQLEEFTPVADAWGCCYEVQEGIREIDSLLDCQRRNIRGFWQKAKSFLKTVSPILFISCIVRWIFGSIFLKAFSFVGFLYLLAIPIISRLSTRRDKKVDIRNQKMDLILKKLYAKEIEEDLKWAQAQLVKNGLLSL